jgi:hypothetical protein
VPRTLLDECEERYMIFGKKIAKQGSHQGRQ